MSYIQRRQRARSRAQRAPLAGMGIWDPIGWLADTSPIQAIAGVVDPKSSNYAEQAACLAKADVSTKNLDAIWYQIAQQWQPSGNFTPTDLNRASSAVYQMLEQAKVAVILSPNSASDRNTMVNQAIDDITKYENQGIPFQQAVTQAQAQGVDAISTEGFKDWVLSSLIAASAAFATRTVLDCNVTWLETAYNYALGVRDIVLSIVTTIVDTAIEAGEAVISVASTAFSLAKYAKYGIIGLAALWVYTRYYATTHATR